VISRAMPKRPSLPQKRPVQSGPSCFAEALPIFDDLAGGEHGFEAEDVVGRHAVFQAVGAAGVEGDVAADRADRLARWVGRVVQAVGRRGERDRGVDHAGLDDGEALGGIDAEDAVEAVERDDETAGDGRGAARETGAAAAGDEGDVFFGAEGGRGRSPLPEFPGRRQRAERFGRR